MIIIVADDYYFQVGGTVVIILCKYFELKNKTTTDELNEWILDEFHCDATGEV